MTKQTIAYHGWIGNRNLGDESLYLANQKMFPSYDLIESEFAQDCEVGLLGGGTLLPDAMKPWSQYHLEERNLNFAVGVGVNPPRFYNRKEPGIDIRRMLGNHGLDCRETLPEPVHYLIRKLNDISPCPVITDKPYFSPKDYRKIREFSFDRLSVRGPESKNLLSQFGIDAPVIGDPALILEPKPDIIRESSSQVMVCLKGSSSLDWRTKWSSSQEYVEHIVTLCNEYNTEFDFAFVPFEPTDIPINKIVSESVRDSKFLDFVSYPDVEGAIREIAKSRVVIGEKLHACVLAAACNTPFISLEYHPKQSDFASSVGMGQFNIKTNKISYEILQNKFETVSYDPDVISNLSSEVESRKNSILKFSEKICEDIKNERP